MAKLKYYWVVEYTDGTKLSQFNSDGTENMWGAVRQGEVIRVSWCEFSIIFAQKVKIPVSWSLIPKRHSLDFNVDDEIFICRRNHIDFSSRGEKGRRIEYILGKNKKEIIKL